MIQEAAAAIGLMLMCAIWCEVEFMSAGYPFAMDAEPAIRKFSELWRAW